MSCAAARQIGKRIGLGHDSVLDLRNRGAHPVSIRTPTIQSFDDMYGEAEMAEVRVFCQHPLPGPRLRSMPRRCP